ncbi:hypothetical protein DF141_00810 [Burkholderia cenocepacia]|nr:hypothetical protein CFB44_19570 [Burkholderia sp. AU31280]RQU45558.1 hypothetical protein DF147_13835 [Burkholderia cenocepacia]RQU81644.1 hypothetical protein DF141_00810 [Burkholderia cenocepacia]RQU94524.1 hypothetical protein DF133_05060 [Burkholderia cenocepacia]RQV23707.1 hypothetical protein DF039_08910 [Burkholderia cenocepacia]
MRGKGRAPALRGARGARNWKLVMIESPSDALHAASTVARISAVIRTEETRQARSGGARG